MSYKHLAREERFLIRHHLQEGCSLREIAGTLGRDSSTISREIKRNTGGRGYRYKQADELAERRRREASSTPRKMTPEQWAVVEDRLVNERWSPDQISGRLRREGEFSVSAKWIYSHIWADRAAGGTLYKSLRRRVKQGGILVEYEGSIIRKEDSYAFLRFSGFQEDIFASRDESDPEEWDKLYTNANIKCALAFSRRGPRAISICLS